MLLLPEKKCTLTRTTSGGNGEDNDDVDCFGTLTNGGGYPDDDDDKNNNGGGGNNINNTRYIISNRYPITIRILSIIRIIPIELIMLDNDHLKFNDINCKRSRPPIGHSDNIDDINDIDDIEKHTRPLDYYTHLIACINDS